MKAVSDFEPQQSRIPELNGPGHIVTHQHPSGLPPSYMDLVWLIGLNPTQIPRTVAEQQDGSVQLFEMRVTKPMDAEEIAMTKAAYYDVINSMPNTDTSEVRMLAIELAVRASNGKLQVKHSKIR